MKPVILVILSSLVVFSCSKKPPTPPSSQIASGLTLETVQPLGVDDYYEAVGTVRAKNTSIVAAKVMGSITAVHVLEGDSVRAGQTLIEIENRDATIQLRKMQAGVSESLNSLEEVERSIRAAESERTAARANETLARTTFNRYEMLFKRQSVSPQEFDEVSAKYEVAKAESERADRMLLVTKARENQVRARIEQARADVANAQVYVSYSRIAAPINGIVVSKQIDVGSMAMPGAPLLSIENNSHYQLEASVEESQLGRINLHDQAVVVVEALGGQEMRGIVEQIVPASDPASRSYLVKISVATDSGVPLKSGLYGKARFIIGQRTVLSVPHKAIAQQGQIAAVFVVDQSGIARLRLVKTGRSLGDRIEVLSGLNQGEQIVSEVVASLKDGTPVRDASKDTQPVAVR